MSSTVVPASPRHSGARQEVLAGLAAPWVLLFLTFALQVDFATLLLMPASAVAVIVVGLRGGHARFVVAYLVGFVSILGLLALLLFQVASVV